ncbi:MAG: hypothetical protein LYZ66_05380 [Nitrososphaerales archaeon]|nr:hypothetical protein [Nitrososphaerales archaeon]
MIATVSGIRGVVNSDISLADFARFSSNFAGFARAEQVLLGRDTRTTGYAASRAVAGAIMSHGASVLDYGMISTPALFRESRNKKRPAIMVTASHNEPEFNGLKFIIDGRGAGSEVLDAVMRKAERGQESFGRGSLKRQAKPSYNDDLVRMFGEGSCEGVRVAVDLGGGAAIFHAVPILQRLGCEVLSIRDACGIFDRKVDPVTDDLSVLMGLVKATKRDVGLGFDCDGDRLVIVDGKGNKRSGDYMLTLAISKLLKGSGGADVVVSADTTVAVDEVVAKLGGTVFRSKVGEANVVSMMREKGVRIGGEGSSGGLIDGSFNFCRDSMLAALVIIRALKAEGQKLYGDVRSYHQERGALQVPRQKALRAIKALARSRRDADTTDGVKIWLSRKSWVLVRPSNTEDVVRVSAEAESANDAARIVKTYLSRVRELSRQHA